jgi:carotenoid 1,2-hydratase
VFSPYYAWAGRRDPENHCAVNVALYGPGRRLWAMTERGRRSLQRSADDLVIAASRASWTGRGLEIDIHERAAPVPEPICGRIVAPAAGLAEVYALDESGRHCWRPFAPDARIEVSFKAPALSWRGRAYVDANWGAEPLEDAFSSWNWSRAHAADAAIIHYDVTTRGGAARSLSLRVSEKGAERQADAPPALVQPPTLWRVPRLVRGGDAPAELVETLEDAPFYARSRLRAPIGGTSAEIFHESLSLDRLRSPIVRLMLPVRMPRRVR